MTERLDTDRLILEAIGTMPFLSRGELAALGGLGDGEARHGLNRLLNSGLVVRVGHARIGKVRTRRWCLTGPGVSELASLRGVDTGELLGVLPVSAEWRAILLRRLDTAEVYYRLAALAAVASGRRCRWHWRRSGWLDGTLEVGRGRYVRVCRIGSAVPRRSILSRLGGMVRMWEEGHVDTALIVVPGHTQARPVERWLRENGSGIFAWVVTEPELAGAGPQDRIWRRPGAFRTRAHPMSRMLAGVGEREGEAGDVSSRTERRGHRSLPGKRTVPVTRQADLLPATLTKAQKDLLDLVADWPLMGSEDLARMLGVSGHGMRRNAGELVRHGLARSLRITAAGARDSAPRMCPGDAGLRLLSWRDRTQLHALRARWGVVPDDAGDPEFGIGGLRLEGGRLRQLARQLRHTDGVHRFVSRLTEACRQSDDAALVEVLPAHRSERWFEIGGRHYGVRPDASGVIGDGRGYLPFLLEYEERATTPAATNSRLDPYRRYFDVVTRVEDWGRHPVVLVLFAETGAASRFAAYCAGHLAAPRTFTGARLPLYVSSAEDLLRSGVLGESWLAPLDLAAGRTAFYRD